MNKFVFSSLFLGLALLGSRAEEPKKDKEDGTTVASLSAKLEDKDEKVQATAAVALAEMLNGKDKKARTSAAEALAKAGLKAKAATDTLKKLAQDKDPQVKGLATYALTYVTFDPKAPLPSADSLIDIVGDSTKTPAERSIAAANLVRHGVKAEQLFPSLVDILKNSKDDAYGRALAAYAMPYVKPNTSEPANPLADAVKDPNQKVAQTAAGSLAKMGEYAKPITAQMINILEKDEDAFKRVLAIYVIRNIKPDFGQVRAPLNKARTKDESEKVKTAAAEALKFLEKQNTMK